MNSTEKQTPTLDEIRKMAHEMDEGLNESSDLFKVAVIMLSAALVTGPHVERVRKFTGYTDGFIRRISYNYRRNKMWIGGSNPRLVTSNWLDEKFGTIGFWNDVNVGLGFVNMVLKPGKEPAYEART